MTPRFQHDCDQCHFIGQTEKYDLYVCGQLGVDKPIYGRTVIGRSGDDGPDYVSGDNMVAIDTPIGRVRLRFDRPGEWLDLTASPSKLD